MRPAVFFGISCRTRGRGLDDGAGAANRDVSKGNWVRSLNGADTGGDQLNLHNLGLLKTINCLGALVVVNKEYASCEGSKMGPLIRPAEVPFSLITGKKRCLELVISIRGIINCGVDAELKDVVR